MVISIFQGTIRVMIAIIAIVLPFVVFIGIPVLIICKIRKRRRK